ncbi:TadE family protein [Massilia endophytica]|uniref:TadE family protein n=1 Tax=Massilia endophytica TaxID=2899220 RepID=UPI001E520F21|nr:TadE/TadG family type IV pilus assembly protein [Massilia endophytica]UGQ46176.1 pilus assembly protein [Massilia endophytica]
MRPDIRKRRGRGVIIVEMALYMLALLVMLVGLFEVSRLLFVWNAVQDVTRRAARAAAMTDFSDPAAMTALRSSALFTAGRMPLAPFLDVNTLRIEYLSQAPGGGPAALTAMPACPMRNAVNCARDPNGGDCIRFVRASFCSNANGECVPVPYEPMLPLLPVNAVVPPSATVVRAESLGRRPGMANCP